MFDIFLLGFGMGVFASIFPGPINLETIRRAISKGPKVATAFGFGAIWADVLLSGAGAFGAAAIFYSLPPWWQGMIGLVSAIIIGFVGWEALQAKVKPPPPIPRDPNDPSYIDVKPDPRGFPRLVKHFFIGFALTITSPSTIGYWLIASVKAAQYFGENQDFARASAPLFISLGVLAACGLWVFGAVTVAGRLHKTLDPKTYLKVERLVGVILMVIASISLFKAARYFSGHAPKPPANMKSPLQRMRDKQTTPTLTSGPSFQPQPSSVATFTTATPEL